MSLFPGPANRARYIQKHFIAEYVITGLFFVRVCMRLLPGPSNRVRYTRTHVITECVVTRFYCISYLLPKPVVWFCPSVVPVRGENAETSIIGISTYVSN